MLTIMDLVVPHNRTAVRPDLDSCQCVAVNVVPFNEASAVTKNVNAALVAIEDGVTPVFGQNNRFEGYLEKCLKRTDTHATLWPH